MNLSTRHSRKPFLSKISSYIEYSVSQLLLAILVMLAKQHSMWEN